jgi:hypothetical protein
MKLNATQFNPIGARRSLILSTRCAGCEPHNNGLSAQETGVRIRGNPGGLIMKRFGHVIVAAVSRLWVLDGASLPVAHAAAITAHGEVAVPVKNVPAGLMAWWIDPNTTLCPLCCNAPVLHWPQIWVAEAVVLPEGVVAGEAAETLFWLHNRAQD